MRRKRMFRNKHIIRIFNLLFFIFLIPISAKAAEKEITGFQQFKFGMSTKEVKDLIKVREDSSSQGTTRVTILSSENKTELIGLQFDMTFVLYDDMLGIIMLSQEENISPDA